MAHVRKNHPLSLYISGKSKPESGLDRLIVLGWKSNTKTGREAHSARCFSVPMWSPKLEGEDKGFIELLVSAFEERQRKTAHTWVTEFLDTNGGVCNDIPAEILEPNKILSDFLSEDSEDGGSRGKLSGDAIGAWYTEKLAPMVMLAVAEKKGWMVEDYQMTAEQEKQIQQTSNNYRSLLERLAAPSPKVDISTAKALRKAVELLGEAKDIIATKLDRKLEAIINPPVGTESLIDLL